MSKGANHTQRIVLIVAAMLILVGAAALAGFLLTREETTAPPSPGTRSGAPPARQEQPTPGRPDRGTGVSGTQQLSNERFGWGFKRKSDHTQPEVPADRRRLLAQYGAFWVGPADRKVVYLTFDAGYERGYTPRILDTLREHGVKAAFFVTGEYIFAQPELVQRMVAEGHIVGNHTMTHPSLPALSDGEIARELDGVAGEFARLTGMQMRYLRPPRGEFSERTLALTCAAGYHNIFWSLALRDWVPLPGGPAEAYRSVMDNLHHGAVILLHAVSADDAAALDRIIKDVKKLGYEFGTLDDLAGCGG